MRIAMWSGPRNLSTAMMYAFGNRNDCAVIDEPFYATYLHMTKLIHPMGDEILQSQSREAPKVIDQLIGAIPGERPIYYQKHMSQHMIEGVNRNWIASVRNVFLIRHPARVIASYSSKRENPTLEDIGFRQQVELFQLAKSYGEDPIVIDSHDIRDNPEVMLRKLCDRLEICFDPAMLHWPSGGHPQDGVWAAHWYGAVHRSTGFAGAEGPLPTVPADLRGVRDQAMVFYDQLRQHKI